MLSNSPSIEEKADIRSVLREIFRASGGDFLKLRPDFVVDEILGMTLKNIYEVLRKELVISGSFSQFEESGICEKLMDGVRVMDFKLEDVDDVLLFVKVRFFLRDFVRFARRLKLTDFVKKFFEIALDEGRREFYADGRIVVERERLDEFLETENVRMVLSDMEDVLRRLKSGDDVFDSEVGSNYSRLLVLFKEFFSSKSGDQKCADLDDELEMRYQFNKFFRNLRVVMGICFPIDREDEIAPRELPIRPGGRI